MEVHTVSGQKLPLSSSTTGNTLGKTAEAGRDTFLRLLVAQLEHQNPLSPMENADFTAQLAQFSTLEQIEAMNKNLTSLVDTQKALSNTQASMQAASLIGKDVQVRHETIQIKDGKWSTLAYTLPSNAVEVSINIVDQAGQLRQSLQKVNQPAGEHAVPRYKDDKQVAQLPDGTYRVVVTARDAAGQILPIATMLQGRVEGVAYVDNQPHFLMGGRHVAFSDIVGIRESRD
jgi:flagellar basal-body rod modification protein FlgD